MTVTISEATWNELLDEARAALGRLDELAAERPQDNGHERHELKVEELEGGIRLATASQFYPSIEDPERAKNSRCLAWRPTDGALLKVTPKVTRTRTRLVTRYSATPVTAESWAKATAKSVKHLLEVSKLACFGIVRIRSAYAGTLGAVERNP